MLEEVNEEVVLEMEEEDIVGNRPKATSALQCKM